MSVPISGSVHEMMVSSAGGWAMQQLLGTAPASSDTAGKHHCQGSGTPGGRNLHAKSTSRHSPPCRWYALPLDIRWISSGREWTLSPITTSPTPPPCGREATDVRRAGQVNSSCNQAQQLYISSHRTNCSTSMNGRHREQPPHLHKLHADMTGALVVPQPLLVQPVHLDPLQPRLPHSCSCRSRPRVLLRLVPTGWA